jgi:tungstate transport system ATP-binding protein
VKADKDPRPPMNEPLLVIEALRKQFGARTVLNIDGLQLDAGRSYALTGDNGAGKTTLLRVMAGLESADLVRARYLGRDIDLDAYPEWLRRDVIYVHQHPYLFRTNVKENIGYGLRVRGIPRKERELLVQEAVAWARVGQLLDTPVQRLSAGEKQRVALARARVLKPRLFLLDEPTANLDSESRQQTIDLVRDLCDSDGTAMIACHDPEIIRLPGICRLHLQGGRIERDWSPLPARPWSGDVASDKPVHHGPQWQQVVND